MKGLLLGVALGLVACGPVKGMFEHGESTVSATVTISDRLQKNEDLLYRLLCAEPEQEELNEVARIATLKGTTEVALDFRLDQALEIGSMCRLEIRALSKGVYAQEASYEFLAESDLFYASAKAPLVKDEGQNSSLDVGLYKMYRDLNVDMKPVALQLTFPEGTEGSFKLRLACGEKQYATVAVLASAVPLHEGTIAVPFKDLAEPLTCDAISAVNDDESILLSGTLAPTVELTRAAAVTIVASLQVSIPPPTDAVAP